MDDLDEFALIKSYASILQVLLYRSYKFLCYHSQKKKKMICHQLQEVIQYSFILLLKCHSLPHQFVIFLK